MLPQFGPAEGRAADTPGIDIAQTSVGNIDEGRLPARAARPVRAKFRRRRCRFSISVSDR
jgi:hypothetical protein